MSTIKSLRMGQTITMGTLVSRIRSKNMLTIIQLAITQTLKATDTIRKSMIRVTTNLKSNIRHKLNTPIESFTTLRPPNTKRDLRSAITLRIKLRDGLA